MDFPLFIWKSVKNEKALIARGKKENPDPNGLFVGALPFDQDSAWQNKPSNLFEPKDVYYEEIKLRKEPLNVMMTLIEHTPSFEKWNEITNHPHEKVVLARKSCYKLETPLSPLDLLAHLASKNPNANLFLYAPDEKSYFLGATPEMLFTLHDGIVTCDALAGTRARGITSEEDERLEKELLTNKKELAEFTFVKDEIERDLFPLLTDGRWRSEDSVKKTPGAQHLFNRARGKIRKGVSPYDLINALHPTPAMGGVPKKDAIDYIKLVEGFKRGYFTAPIGWTDGKNAEFGVAIRCALLEENKLHLFAGAGIVPASDPLAEWNELGLKCEVVKSCLI